MIESDEEHRMAQVQADLADLHALIKRVANDPDPEGWTSINQVLAGYRRDVAKLELELQQLDVARTEKLWLEYDRAIVAYAGEQQHSSEPFDPGPILESARQRVEQARRALRMAGLPEPSAEEDEAVIAVGEKAYPDMSGCREAREQHRAARGQ